MGRCILKKLFVLGCFVIMLFCLPYGIFAQRVRASVAMGASAYNGELQKDEYAILKESSPALTLGLSYDFTKWLRGRVDVSVMGVKGDDKLNTTSYYSFRNLNFKSTIIEAGFLAEIAFVNYEHKIVPYIFLGPSVYHFNPTTIDKNGKKVSLHDVGTEGQLLGDPTYNSRKYSLTQINFQGGLGVRYNVNDDLSFGFEYSLRQLFTDYLDDVSAYSYVDRSVFNAAGQSEAADLSFRADEIGYDYNTYKTTFRGSPKGTDLYYSIQLKATFRLANIHLGRGLDFYDNDNYRSKRSVKNPKNLF